MKYTRVTSWDKIKKEYDYVIGWGSGPLFQMNYNPHVFKLAVVIDGMKKNIGQEINGVSIKGEEYLEELEGKILVIIYSIYEQEIVEQIKKYNKQIDTIVYTLLEINDTNIYVPRINGKSGEDYILVTLLRQMHLNSIQYLEIGVYHPILRNNTYLLYQMFANVEGYKGVLVDANPVCWNLIEQYREKDELIKCGVSSDESNTKLMFYMFPHLLGHSTFVKRTAERKVKEGYEFNKIEVPVMNINKILSDNFEYVPDLLELDIEGLDYEVLESWDENRFPIKIVLTEVTECGGKKIESLMVKKGYKCFATTMENAIWIRNEIKIFL